MINPDQLFFNYKEQHKKIMDAHTVFIHEKKVLDKNPEQKNHDVHPISFLFQKKTEQSEMSNIMEFKSNNNLSKSFDLDSEYAEKKFAH